MSRIKTLYTGQWTDLPLEELAAKAARWGYDGLELACWGDHFELARAGDAKYITERKQLLARHGLVCRAISCHRIGQMVLDRNDARSDAWAPEKLRGDSAAKSVWAAEEMQRAARSAATLGVAVVTGFVGSSIWPLWYSFPPVSEAEIEVGFKLFAERWNPILDVFDQSNVKFAFEVHPTQIAFDFYSAERALKAIDRRPAFGFNFDPSHLVWQGVDPVRFLHEFADRIYHVHIKDVAVNLDGAAGILGSHLPAGDRRRGWDFRGPGRGDVPFEAIIRALNEIGYQGPLSVEWSDAGMDREYGAADALQFLARLDFEPNHSASGTAVRLNAEKK